MAHCNYLHVANAVVSRGQIHNGTWYMYYIVGGECPGRWVAYAYATSTDGVHWTDQGDMLYPLTQPGKLQSCNNPTYELGSGYELTRAD